MSDRTHDEVEGMSANAVAARAPTAYIHFAARKFAFYVGQISMFSGNVVVEQQTYDIFNDAWKRARAVSDSLGLPLAPERIALSLGTKIPLTDCVAVFYREVP